MTNNLRQYTGKDLRECTKLELFNALLKYTDAAAVNKGYNQGKKKADKLTEKELRAQCLDDDEFSVTVFDEKAKIEWLIRR